MHEVHPCGAAAELVDIADIIIVFIIISVLFGLLVFDIGEVLGLGELGEGD